MDELLQHELSELLDEKFTKELKKEDHSAGCDHGKGRLTMTITNFLRTATETRSRRFVAGQITCKKDSADVMKETFLKKQNKA